VIFVGCKSVSSYRVALVFLVSVIGLGVRVLPSRLLQVLYSSRFVVCVLFL